MLQGVGHLAGFLVMAAIAAGASAFYYLVVDTTHYYLTLGLYGLAIFALALIYRRVSPIKKSLVDFTYYSLGIVGVAFLATGDEQARLSAVSAVDEELTEASFSSYLYQIQTAQALSDSLESDAVGTMQRLREAAQKAYG